MADIDQPRRPRSARAIAAYTQVRHWHGYLSAFAFLALIFFSFSGILLNHPDWLPEEAEGAQVAATLPAAQVAAAAKAADPGAALGLLAAQHIRLKGAYASADIDSGIARLRFNGVKGSSDLTLDLKSGAAHGEVRGADALTMLDDLHRGKNAGAAWRAVIDLSGALVLALSLLGYILFFTLRFRLRVALVLTGVSLAALGGIFLVLVP